ncbi:MAG: alpha/beta hydrolase [Microcella sp.]|uniref:alpha/beta fold hydrolase n=1 Tax=Microcella sp. TaxID=1913979 RepID=UPI0024C627D8|nr:alpha/beta hydrolase [Microcella sp.]UYN83055.1 MAG: alpha/beta hydrolase [Microcella sp.]
MTNELELTLSDGRIITYLEAGDPAGEPVLYSHGAPSGKLEILFFDLHERAVAARVRLIVADRPGVGGSTAQPSRTMLDAGRDACELADALGIERFALLGYSVGGAFALATRHVAAGRITATAIVSGIGPADAPGMTEGRSSDVSRIFSMAMRAPRLTQLMLRFMRFGTRTPDRMIAATGKSMPPPDRAVAERQGAAEPFAAFLADALREGTRGVLRDLQLAASPWGFTPQSGASSVAVWHGAADRNAPVGSAHWLADRLPEAVVTVTDDDGHISLFDREAEAVLVTLAELSRAARVD